MLPMADQTAGPIGLKFFVDTHGWPGSFTGQKKLIFSPNTFYYFFSNFFSTGNAGPFS